MKKLITFLLLAFLLFSCIYCIMEVIVLLVNFMMKNAADHSRMFMLGTVNE